MVSNVALTVVVGLVVAVGVIGVMAMRKRKDRGTKVKRVPGNFIVGNFFDMGIDVILGKLRDHVKNHGKIFLLEVFDKKILHISDVKACREILTKRPKLLKRGSALESMAFRMGFLPYGLFHAHDPAIWMKMKKMSAPAFSKQNVQGMVKVFYDEAMLLVDRLNAAADAGKTVDVMRETTTMTVQVISKVAFGNEPVEYFYSEKFYEDVGITFRVVLEDAMFHLPRWVWKLTPMYKTELLAAEGNARLEQACMEVVTRTRKQYATLSEEDKKHTHSLIDIMVRQEGVTDEEILANVKTFYLAGSDTTSVSMSWAMFLLHQHPVVVARMREEVRSLFAHNLAEMSAQAIADLIPTLPYSMAVFKEAVRLYPVGPLIFLDFIEDEPLTLSDGMVIDCDKTLMIHAWACHFDEEYFPNAHAFEPARWLTQDKEALGRMEQAFLGFGGGTRACPGMGLALSEGVVGLAAVVHHFDFELACPLEDVQVLYKFTMQPSQLPMRVTRRKI